ncbi:Maff2 family protein, partial [Butyrivibrio sp. INlla16]
GILRQNSALFIFGFRTKIQKTTKKQQSAFLVSATMEFFQSAITSLQTLVVALGAGLGAWGVINLLEGYGNDNPGAKSQGIKQLMAGGGVCLIGTNLIPLLANLF